MTLLDEALAALARGWVLHPLNGKVALQQEWQKRTESEERHVRGWIDRGWNLGVICGPASGLFLLDEDTPKGGDLRKLWSALGVQEPRTPTARTGGGGRHLYFRCPDPPVGNTASKLGHAIDTKCRGGYGLLPGSVHPVTGEVYEWILHPSDTPLSSVPRALLARLRSPRPGRVERYVDAALEAEAALVREAPEGARNDTLNRAAFSLGTLVPHLDPDRIRARLEAEAADLARSDGTDSVQATIESGINAGMGRPREIPRGRSTAYVSAQPDESPNTLTPGTHVDDSGCEHEISNEAFASSVIAKLPPGTLYRRGETLGELIGDVGSLRFRAVSNERFRLIVDSSMRLCRWKKAKGDNMPMPLYVNCSRDYSALTIAAGEISPTVRDLHLLTNYPVFDTSMQLVRPGWNGSSGIYYDEPEELSGLRTDRTVEECRSLLEDLTCDFPWSTDHKGPSGGSSSRENFYGLMLTPMLRPAIEGNVPMHLITSPMPRTGKSKLAEQVLGGVYLGEPAPMRQLGKDEAETEKRIYSYLMQSNTIIHFDNIRDFLDSASLASLLTATTFSTRLLNTNTCPALPNNLVLVFSGNNVRATEEIVKRSVPITFAPTTDEPELRTDFRHPDLASYVRDVQRDVLSVLASMIVRWRDGQRVSGIHPKGGFEEWSAIVGGVLLENGFGRWRTNERAWARASDPLGEDLRTLVDEWDARYPDRMVTAKELHAIVEENDLFSGQLRSNTERGRLTAFGMLLRRHADAVVSGKVGAKIIRRMGRQAQSLWGLDDAP